MKYLLIALLVLQQPVINPDNVKPGSWFIETSKAEQEAFRQLVCAIQTNSTKGCDK